MTDREIMWVAGLLEGEGSFGLGPYGGRKENPIRQLRITCAMTDRDVIVKLMELCGGNLNKESRLDPRRLGKCKPLFVWNMTKRNDVVALLNEIRPFMGERRGNKIDELLEYAKIHPLIYRGLIHGTRNGYRSHGCRCENCRGEVARYARERRKVIKTIQNQIISL